MLSVRRPVRRPRKVRKRIPRSSDIGAHPGVVIHTVADAERVIANNLHLIREIPFDVVVHVPRSGTIPASIIATFMNKPLASVEEYCAGIIYMRRCETDKTDHVLVVDDFTRTAAQLKPAIDKIKACRPGVTITVLSMFLRANPHCAYPPDLSLLKVTGTPYYCTWFLWKTPRVREIAFDMDGVFCEDCPREDDDEGDRYLAFLDRARVKFHTPHETGWIITSRLERYRAQTVEWLRRHNIKTRNLIMGPWSSNAERAGNQASWKARQYQDCNAVLYVESHDSTSRKVAERSGKPVLSIETHRRYG